MKSLQKDKTVEDIKISALQPFENHTYESYARYNGNSVAQQMELDKESDSPNQTPITRYHNFVKWVGVMKFMYVSSKSMRVSSMHSSFPIHLELFDYQEFRSFVNQTVDEIVRQKANAAIQAFFD